jgi:hypothetical protein
MNRIAFVSAVVFFLLFINSSPAIATDEIRTERVHFKKGATTAVIKGRLQCEELGTSIKL